MKKNVVAIVPSPAGHWVGDGFPVRSLLTYDKWASYVSPFLMLDYAGPADFTPGTRPRGVGEHPHRGFETVTLVFSGEVAHRDSAGGGGTIGPGDVQWMTAASGILHDEFHSPAFTRSGGTLEMVQLWVNLPAKHKMADPRYQSIVSAAIPEATLPGGAGRVRIVAGDFAGLKGPAATFTPLNVWDVQIHAAQGASFDLPDGHTTAIAVLKGAVTVNGSVPVRAPGLIVLDRAGANVRVDAGATDEAMILVLSGEPIDEPIVAYGPFVMNSREEIEAAMNDFRLGRFGRMAGVGASA